MILLVTPPFVQPNAPYPATPQLAGFLRSRGYAVAQRDLSVETALETLRTFGDDFTDEALEILQNPHLAPDDKVETTRCVDELAASIRDEVDADFGFSRYAEKLSVSLPTMGPLLRRLRRHSPVDRILEAKMAEALRDAGFLGGARRRKGARRIVGVTCPFPGTLLGAFRVAETVKRLDPAIETVLGGGYVNTELRQMDDPRVGRYFDAVMYDEGYAPWLEFLRDARMNAPPPVFVKPDYAGLDLGLYFDLPETENPMQRMWSTGRWIKVQLARGCYWHKCAFCDVALDYVKGFARPRAEEVVDALEALARETGETGFHFTDEAIPPALAEGVSREILRRKFKCRWWGNVRFEKTYAPRLCRLMARAGCLAVTGGLECAVDRLLARMNKGITCAGARAVLANFAAAGIRAHAYLMYAFPGETEGEARRALVFVRDLFRAGLVQSAFFHRFALTAHSPIARDPAAFGIVLPEAVRRALAGDDPVHPRFALNEIPYDEPGAPDWDRIGRALKLALYNYQEGRGLGKSASFWFAAARESR